MVGLVVTAALSELHAAASVEDQIASLKRIKHQIIGHDQHKEALVSLGLTETLSQILGSAARPIGKRRRTETNGSGPTTQLVDWSDLDELRLQATLVVGTLANGGPAFLPPLYAAGLLPSLLSQLSPDYVPLKLIVGTLETLNSVADAIVHAGPRLNIFHAAAKPLCALLYAEPGTTTLAELLRLKANSRAAQRAVCLTVKIIAKTCSQEQDRYEAVKARLLDLLAGRLASCVVSLGYCPPTADLSVIQSLPSALPKTELPSLMLALCAIVQNSTYRASKLLYSPPIIAVFPPKNDQPFSSTSPASNPFDQLLPRVQATRQKTDKNSKAFPPLGSLHDASEFHSDPNVQEAIANLIHDAGWITDDMESPLLSWLMYLIRTQWGKTQLTAAWLLTVLCRAVGPFQRNKLKMLATFVIPIVVSMLADQVPAEGPKSASTYGVPNPTVDAGTRAMTPRILAELMSSRPALQSINTNLKMRDLVMKGLKGTFQPSGEDKRLWSPVPAAERQHHVDLPETRRLGPPGCTDKKLAHYSRREAYLLAVAALTQKDDAHRKFFIEKGVIQCLLDSLKPLAEDLTYPKGSGEEENAKKQGNPTPVLVAACNTARALARSVAGLRTSLVDGGIAMPIYELLKHPDIDVQTAATDALCNLLLDFSPMKQPLLEAGVIRTLCEQAHSANANMRHISIWALKQAVSYAPDAIKIQALEDIGPGWLVQIISGEQRQPSAAAQSIGLGTANAMGEQVDLLNAPLPSESVDKEMEDGESDGEPSSPMQSAAEFDYTQITTQFPQPSSKIRAHLNQLYRNETSPILRAQRDDLQLQEQALEFARNLIYQPAAAGANPRPEMIDHVLRELGTTQVFALLQQKLAIEVPLSGNSADTLRAQPTCRERLCISAILFLNNVAAGRPSHRALLLSHPPLLIHILSLLQHPNREIRLNACYTIINMSWTDDATDAPFAAQRIYEMRKMRGTRGEGLVEVLVGLRDADPDLDVRERAKTAVEQIMGPPGAPDAGALAHGGPGGIRGLL